MKKPCDAIFGDTQSRQYRVKGTISSSALQALNNVLRDNGFPVAEIHGNEVEVKSFSSIANHFSKISNQFSMISFENMMLKSNCSQCQAEIEMYNFICDYLRYLENKIDKSEG